MESSLLKPLNGKDNIPFELFNSRNFIKELQLSLTELQKSFIWRVELIASCMGKYISSGYRYPLSVSQIEYNLSLFIFEFIIKLNKQQYRSYNSLYPEAKA